MSGFRDGLLRALEPVLSDTESGSRAIAFALAEEMSGIDPHAFIPRDDFISLARTLLPRLSAFALVFDLLHRLGISQFADPGARGAEGHAFSAACDRWLSAALHASDAQCGHAAAGIPATPVLATISNSGAVLSLGRRLHAQGREARLLCAESQPGGEGRILAEALRVDGIAAELVADDELPSRLRETHAVVMGADAVLATEIWNKTGSRRLATEAVERGQPVIVLAEYSKWAPSAWGLSLPGHTVREASSPVPRADLFEAVPLDLVASIACEDGLLPPSRAPSVISSRPVFAPLLPPF